ncbi:MAG: hypothetical protein J5I62_14870 [Flavobacteriales bacterium]|nr:hypothetical protein [Flavobacteriales bacterium]MEB2341940.1 phospholipase [Flavobacteriia bacterium]
MEEHHITVPRTARYHTLGQAATARELWMVLHGYGQLARFFLRPFEGLENGRLIAAPEGLSRFYTDEAHSRVGATWMTREDREAEIRDQASYLDALAEHLLAQCPPNTPLHVLGFSQGVATVCRWAMAPAFPIQRMVLWAGSMATELKVPQLAACWKNTKLVLVRGRQDHLVGQEELERSEARLREARVNFRTIHFPGGHALDRVMLRQVMNDDPPAPGPRYPSE